MNRTLRWLLVVLVALAPALAPTAALADTGPAGCNLTSSGSCMREIPPACEGQCTGPALVAECDSQCTASPAPSCTATCSATCMMQCAAGSGTFGCTSACTSDCQGACTTGCSTQGAGCASDCMLDCSNGCGIQCAPLTPSADCPTQCQAACNGSCLVQANLDCHANCTANTAPAECTTDCMAPGGAVFCGTPTQYIDFATAPPACVTYLASQGITAGGSSSGGSPGGGGTKTGGGGGCTVARGPAGFEASPVMLGLALLGLGLRRRRASKFH